VGRIVMSDIKSQVEECLKQAEEIERAGVIKDKLNTTFRENLRYEFLKFLVYLSDGDGYVDEKEIAFINSTLGYRMTEGQIKSIMTSFMTIHILRRFHLP
jgi:hypothetical protein